MNVIKGHFSHHYTTNIFRALNEVKDIFGFELINDESLPKEFLYVNDKLIGYIAWWDSMMFTNHDIINMKENDFSIIFKYHYSPNLVDYSIYEKYQNRIVPCGLWRTWEDEPEYQGWNYNNVLNSNRNIDVMASMRHTNSGTINLPSDKWPAWAHIRLNLREQADQLGKEGYSTWTKMIKRKDYVDMLRNTKLSFIWSASSYLGWKIPEFTQEGVIMITEPLGKNYPLCNDVTFEDDVHCIFCNDHTKFSSIAKDLLKDHDRMNYLRKNILDLWETKLNRKSVGTWYYNKLMESYMDKNSK